MNTDHVISDEVLDLVNTALSKGENWMAYNKSLYFVDKEDVQFFLDKDEANDFAANNISDKDSFHVIHFNSILDIYKEIPYGTKMEMQLINSPDANGLYNHEGNAFTDALIDHAEEQLLNTKKTNIMNDKNYDYLKDQLKYTGFGDGLQNELKEKMEKQSPEFQLKHSQKFGKDEMSATLHFKKSNESEMYFFNKYDAALKPANNADAIQQTFYINKESNITLKEGYNLMSGRAVNKDLTTKEGQKYNAWVQMDFKETDTSGNFRMKQFHQNYGYNLEQVLTKLPIKELATDTEKASLVQSLEKGNRQAVTFVQDGKEQRQFIEANPQFKSITVYDANMQRVNNQVQKEKESQGQSTKQDAKKEVKAGDDEGESAPVNRQKSKKKKGVSVS